MKRSAPAKINLGLAVGALRADGRHELVSVMQAVSLCDELELVDGAGADEVVCPGVGGENLAARALALLRERSGWSGPPQRLAISKRIPVAAGLGGGSSDAAAALAMLAERAGVDDRALLHELAAQLGADVPALLEPGRVLARGAGERLTALPRSEDLYVLVLPAPGGLSTAAVYRRFDELGHPRSDAALDAVAADLARNLADGRALPEPALLANDLEPAAISLDPTIGERLARLHCAGADHALVSGSGPTTLGLYAGGDAKTRWEAGARSVAGALAVQAI